MIDDTRVNPTESRDAGRLPGIDGLRALAVAGVLLFHGDVPGLFPGGFLGVDVFFVISGFLITMLLARERRATGRIAIGAFYLRRAKRLFPAAYALIVASVAAAWLLAPDALGRLQRDVPAALVYAANWWQVFSSQSYFELIGRPALLQHLWSLAIEEQFYLAWPVLALLVLRAGGEGRLAALALALAVAVTAWMAWLAGRHGYPADADPSRVYLGTDTHSMGLLLGAALGAAWHRWTAIAPRVPVVLVDALGVTGLALLLVVMARVNETQPLLYRGGFLAVAALGATLVACAADSRSATGRFLSLQPLRWVGERSYGLYLWHWPVFALLRPGFELPVDPWLALVLRLAVTAAIAECSYRWLEVPIRSGAVGAWRPRAQAALGAVAGVSVVVLASLLIRAAVVTDAPDDVIAALGPGAATAAKVVESRDVAQAVEAPGGPPARPETGSQGQVLTAIGDSVLLGAGAQFARLIEGVHLDAEVGRQGKQGLERVRELKAQGALAPLVLVHLGTNGYLTESHMRALLGDLADRRRVLLVNVRAPRRWVAHNNDLFDRIRGDYPNVALVDWAELSRDRPEFFASDGIHLTAAGGRAFALAVRAMAELPERSTDAPPRLHHVRLPTPAPAAAARAAEALAAAPVPQPSCSPPDVVDGCPEELSGPGVAAASESGLAEAREAATGVASINDVARVPPDSPVPSLVPARASQPGPEPPACPADPSGGQPLPAACEPPRPTPWVTSASTDTPGNGILR